VTIKTTWLQTEVYNAVNDRLVAGLFLAPSTNPLSGEGWVAGGLIPAARATPNWSVDVSPGRAVCPTPASDGGAYAVLSDATENVVVPPVSTQPRRDLVVLEVADPDYAGSVSAGQFRCVAGTASASPVLPALPSGAVKICELSHLANATAVATATIVNPRAVGSPQGRTPTARLLLTGLLDLPNNVPTTVTFGAHAWDTHGGHSATVNPSRWTCPVGWDGVYDLSGNVWLGPQTTFNQVGVRFGEFHKNGAAIPYSAVRMPPINDAFQVGFHVGSQVYLVAGDYVELKVLQNSGFASKIYADGQFGTCMDVKLVTRV
jgi:hypothetical protein